LPWQATSVNDAGSRDRSLRRSNGASTWNIPMRKRRQFSTAWALAVGLMALAAMPSTGLAQQTRAGAITIAEPWLRAPPAAAKVAGGYMILTNTGQAADRLIGGALAVAGRVEVHEMAVTDGVMRMRALPAGLELAPGATIVLKPGSYHLMFLDLPAVPAPGTTLKGTLVFEKSGTVEIEYRVLATDRAGKGSGSGSGSHANH
jgi:periplasmic copper chaperone A